MNIECAAACDMRFGVQEKTMINQMELPLGTLPGDSGAKRLPRLVRRGRAMTVGRQTREGESRMGQLALEFSEPR
jgi:enoyl-CoA hydratase/carnithine racemase